MAHLNPGSSSPTQKQSWIRMRMSGNSTPLREGFRLRHAPATGPEVEATSESFAKYHRSAALTSSRVFHTAPVVSTTKRQGSNLLAEAPRGTRRSIRAELLNVNGTRGVGVAPEGEGAVRGRRPAAPDGPPTSPGDGEEE